MFQLAYEEIDWDYFIETAKNAKWLAELEVTAALDNYSYAHLGEHMRKKS